MGERRKSPYYELHITLLEPFSKQEEVKNAMRGTTWTFSMIDGDPIVGPGTKMYATTHLDAGGGGAFKAAHAALLEMSVYLYAKGFNVIRRKIETVVLDEHKGRDFPC